MEWDVKAYDKMLTFQVEINKEVEMFLVQNKFFLMADSILDVGCGNGYFTAALADMYPQKQFVAIDSSKELYEFATRNNSRQNITYIHADYSELKLQKLYDFVITRLVVHIIPDRINFFQWVYERLRLGGAFCVIDADDDNYSVYPEMPIFSSLEDQTNDKINHVGARDTKNIVQSEICTCGFKKDRFFTFSPNSITVDKSLIMRYMLYVMRIEKGNQLPLEAYKELLEWYDNDDAFFQYGLYFGLFLKEEKIYEG